MSSPVVPSDLKRKIPSVTAAMCSRFRDFLAFPKLFYDLYAYERNEQGDITDEYCADINSCSGVCDGVVTPDDPGNHTGGTLSKPVVVASDGTFTDKVSVTWTAPAGATRYEVWRGLDNDVMHASKLSDVNAVTAYSDTTGEAGVIYWYFVRAFSDTASSSFSAGDSGYAGSLVPELDSVTDLVASKGFFPHVAGSAICLVWTKVADVQMYDIYRNTTDDYTTATRIDSNRTPYVFKDSAPTNYGPYPQFVDNGTELAYHDSIGTSSSDAGSWTNYYYWVVPKRSNPAAVGGFSNSNAGALGWAFGQGGGISPLQTLAYDLISGGAAVTTPAAATSAWLVLFGGKAGGAGGNAGFGGGGGGMNGGVTGLVSVSSTSKFRLVSSPESDPAAATTATNGTDGPTATLQYSALGDFSDTVSLIVCNAPGGGQWNAAGGGTGGGAGTTPTATGAVAPQNIYPGRAGYPAVGSSGGDSGYLFGFFKGPLAPVKILNQFGDATTTHAGGGAASVPGNAALSVGGKGLRGAAFVIFY